MNQQHYEKLQRVLRRSQAEWGHQDARFKAIGHPSGESRKAEYAATLFLPYVCEDFWRDDFPKEQGYGATVTLDLNGADLKKGVFAMLTGEQLNGANFRNACLDGTLWSVHASGVDFTEASFRRAYIVSSTFSKCVFRRATLCDSIIDRLHCDDGQQSDFSEADLSNSTIRLFGDPHGMILTDANLTGCRILVASGRKRSERKRALMDFLDNLSEEQRGQIVLDDSHRELMVEDKSACFIATAACGTDQAEEVVKLRAYRDVILQQAKLGRAFITAYEAMSPPLARLIARSVLARSLVRSLIVRPARYVADHSLSRPSPSVRNGNENH